MKTMGFGRRSCAAALSALLILPLSGCFFSREIAETRREIERAYPELELERQIVLNLGPLSLRTVRWFTGMLAGEEVDMATRYLRDVSRVKVGVFRSENPNALQEFDAGRIRFDEDWTTAVKTQEEESRVWILYRDDGRTVRDLYLVILDEEDLAIARVRGNLGRLVGRIVQDHVDFSTLMNGGS